MTSELCQIWKIRVRTKDQLRLRNSHRTHSLVSWIPTKSSTTRLTLETKGTNSIRAKQLRQTLWSTSQMSEPYRPKPIDSGRARAQLWITHLCTWKRSTQSWSRQATSKTQVAASYACTCNAHWTNDRLKTTSCNKTSTTWEARVKTKALKRPSLGTKSSWMSPHQRSTWRRDSHRWLPNNSYFPVGTPSIKSSLTLSFRSMTR